MPTTSANNRDVPSNGRSSTTLRGTAGRRRRNGSGDGTAAGTEGGGVDTAAAAAAAAGETATTAGTGDGDGDGIAQEACDRRRGQYDPTQHDGGNSGPGRMGLIILFFTATRYAFLSAFGAAAAAAAMCVVIYFRHR